MDQAKELRTMINNTKPSIKDSLSAKVITISSGKGGVGKTNFSANLAIHLANRQKRVVIIDADFGLADIEILLGVCPQYNFYHILKSKKTISEVIMDTKFGIKFISGGSGLQELANITSQEIKHFIEQFEYIDKMADIIIIDTGAGISTSVTSFIKAANEPIIITTPEPTSFIDAYTLIKIIKEQNDTLDSIKIIVNKADDMYEADRVFRKIEYVCQKFLNIKIEKVGHILSDTSLVKAVKKQVPVILSYPDSDFSKSIKEIGDKIISEPTNLHGENGIKGFVKRLLKNFNK